MEAFVIISRISDPEFSKTEFEGTYWSNFDNKMINTNLDIRRKVQVSECKLQVV